MKLAEFKTKDGHFSIYGTYTIETGKTLEKTLEFSTYNYPEFYDLEAKQIINGEEISYEPDGHTWSGRKYVAEDMICEFIMCHFLGSALFEFVFLEKGLMSFVKAYTDNTVQVNGASFNKRVLAHDMCDLFQLFLVTDQYTYYGSDDRFLMISTDTRNVVSDNYFAECGYFESAKNVRNGKETLLWGELPEEEEE